MSRSEQKWRLLLYHDQPLSNRAAPKIPFRKTQPYQKMLLNRIKIYKKSCILWFFNYTKRLCYLLSEQGRGEAPSVPPHPALLLYEHLKYIHKRLYYFKYNYAIFLFGSTPIQGEPAFVARFFRHKRS